MTTDTPTSKQAFEAAAVVDAYNHAHPASTIIDNTDFTDVGNARRLIARFGNRLRYCHPWKSWLCWNGRYWERDNTGQVMRWAKETVEAMLAEADGWTGDMRDRMHRHAIASKSVTKLKAMVSLAESESSVPILPDAFDVDIWLFNTPNGTIDLRTGGIRAHDIKDYITKISPVEYNPDAKCERWLSFLNTVFAGKTELIEYVQKIAGQCLTGDASDEQLFIFWGNGANGKTTFVEAIGYICADYAKTIAVDALLKKEKASVSNDIARLKGARMVYANEPGFGDTLSEGKIKELTGRNTISARFLFQENFEFKPEYKIIISTNHKPTIKGGDEGIWRRIKLVPFDVTIPKEERDKNLDQKLRDEARGILNWCIAGCKKWQKNGLDAPQEVIEATDEYQDDMDKLTDFFNIICIKKSGVVTPFNILYFVYKVYCQVCEIRPVAEKTFSQICTERGFKKSRTYITVGNNKVRTRTIEGIHLSQGTDEFMSSVPSFYEATDGDIEVIKTRLGQIITQILYPFYYEPHVPPDLKSVPSVPSVPRTASDSDNSDTIYNSLSVPSVPSVPINNNILIKLKEKYDKINKPDLIIDFERLKENMRGFILTEFDEFTELNHIDIMALIESYWAQRDRPQIEMISTILIIISQAQAAMGNSIPLTQILSSSAAAGLSAETTLDMIEKLKFAGEIIEVSEDRYRVV